MLRRQARAPRRRRTRPGRRAGGEPGRAERQAGADPAASGGEEEFPHFVEVWNDYDPSQRFVAIFPVGEKEGATASSVAYYIIEPGKHSGVHSDNAEEIVFVAEGEGEVFMIGRVAAASRPASSSSSRRAPTTTSTRRAPTALRLLSFFPTTEIVSTFQQVDLPGRRRPFSARSRRSRRCSSSTPTTCRRTSRSTLEELGMADGGPGAAGADRDPAAARDDRAGRAAARGEDDDLHAGRGQGRGVRHLPRRPARSRSRRASLPRRRRRRPARAPIATRRPSLRPG